MADQNITELPIKTNTGVANTDYMLGIDASEGYQILVNDVAKYTVENYNGSTLAGTAQTPKSAIDALNSNLPYLTNSTILEYVKSKITAGIKRGTFLCSSGVTDTPTNATGWYVWYTSNAGTGTVMLWARSTTSSLLAESAVYVSYYTSSTTALSWVKEPTREEVDALNSNLTSKHKTISLLANASQAVTLDGNIGIIVAARYDSYQVLLVNYWSASTISLHAVGNARISISKTANSKDIAITNLMDGNTSVMILS